MAGAHLDGHHQTVHLLEEGRGLPREVGLSLILAGDDGYPSPTASSWIEGHGVDLVEYTSVLQKFR